MQPTDDGALLRQYVENSSDEAFAGLVTRHINLVYSVALRQVGNPHAAEEITQAVFIILAKKAVQLRHYRALSSWLFQATRLTAGNFIRSESRRHRREEEAYMQTVLDKAGTEVWPRIAPLLDTAVAALREKDRQAIVLRFYEGRNLREVGLALGTSKDAAEKRVNRTLEKLRKNFTKRGVSSTTAIIAGAISANSVQAAPVALAKSATAVAITKGVAASGSTLTLIQGALKIMAWTKLKTAAVTTAALILAAGTPVVVHVVHQHQAEGSLFSSETELSANDNANYETLTGTTPAQVAKVFFDACSQEDWAAADKYWQTDPRNKNSPGAFPDSFKEYYGGLQIISVGNPFKARISIAALLTMQPNLRNQFSSTKGDFEARSVFVPFEMRLKDGTIRKWQLSIRCDNPEHRWYYDGGM
jgi:RNA polymerase sigma factor (sigma-70 family)